jgi:hypothetical protein
MSHIFCTRQYHACQALSGDVSSHGLSENDQISGKTKGAAHYFLKEKVEVYVAM